MTDAETILLLKQRIGNAVMGFRTYPKIARVISIMLGQAQCEGLLAGPPEYEAGKITVKLAPEIRAIDIEMDFYRK